MNFDETCPPLVSVVTVTWNAKKYSQEYLHSLVRIHDVPLEIIVVDNASCDGTPEMIESNFTQVKLIREVHNLGFAAANNIGMKICRGRFIALINSDVVVPPACLGKLCRFMEANPSVGMVGPQMLGSDGSVRRSTMRLPSLVNSFARALALDRLACLSRLFTGQLMADFEHDNIAEVEVLNGWFWIVQRDALENVGSLDERFFMYGEDIDWCRRFRDAGWRIMFCPFANAIHYGGASSSVSPLRFYIEMQRANLQYWSKHHGWLAQALNFAALVLQHALRFIIYFGLRIRSSAKTEEIQVKKRRSWAALKWLLRIEVPSVGPKQSSYDRSPASCRTVKGHSVF